MNESVLEINNETLDENIDINEEQIINNVSTGDGAGESGATFIPNVSEEGIISWTNDKGLENPEPMNIRGQQGETGPQGPKG